MYGKLLIFRHTPIDVDIKMYEYFAENLWQSDVIVYAETSFNSSRSVCGYHQNTTNIQTVVLDESGLKIDDSFFLLNKVEVFLFYGIQMAKKYLLYIKKYHIKYGIISERDISFYDKYTIKMAIKKTFPFIQYCCNRYLFSNTKCFLAMGQEGVRCFNRYYCINKKALFDFMYNDGNSSLKPILEDKKDTIKFVYVGRFDYRIKGVDTLIKAFINLSGNPSLDLIGGYGNDANAIKEEIKKIPKARCIEACNKDELCNKLNQYDVIIVPSNLDGWNLHCNLSINAGLGIITTDQAASEELVRCCGNGVVIRAGDEMALQKELQKILDNPLIINGWKKKTVDYSERISYISVANYLFNILKYSFGDHQNAKKPTCPWL